MAARATRKRKRGSPPGTKGGARSAFEAAGASPDLSARILKAMNRAGTMSQALDRLLIEVCRAPGVDGAGVYFVSEDQTELTLVAVRGLSKRFVSAVNHIPLSDKRVRMLEEGRPFYKSVDLAPAYTIYNTEKIRCFGAIPVRFRGRVVASLNVASKSVPDIPRPVRLVVETLAEHLGGLFARARADKTTATIRDNLQNLFNTLDDKLFIVDHDGRVVHINPSAAKKLGRSVSKIVGSPLLQLFRPYDEEQAKKFESACGCRGIRECHGTLNMAKGRGLPVEARIVCGNWNGQTVCFISMRDVSDRVLYEKKLLQTIGDLSDFQRLINDSGAVAYCADTPELSPLRYVSPTIDKLGYSARELMAGTVSGRDIVHPDDLPWILREYRNGLAERKPMMLFRYRVRTRSGEIRWLQDHISPRYDEQGRPGRVFGLQFDVTDQVTADEKIRVAVRQFQYAVDHIEGIFFHLSYPSLAVIFVNDAHEKIIGHPKSDLGKHPLAWTEHIHPDDRAKSIRYVKSAGYMGRKDHYFRIVRSDGEVRWLHSRISPLRDEKGVVTQLIGTAFDVTERVRDEERLRYRNRIESALADCSRKLNNLTIANESKLVTSVLRRVAATLGVQRAAYHDFDQKAGLVVFRHEWVAPGRFKLSNRVRQVPMASYPYMTVRFTRHETVVVNRVEDAPAEAEPEKNLWRMLGARAVVLAPAYFGSRAFGCLSLSDCVREREWSGDEVRMVRLIGEMIAHNLDRIRALELLSRREQAERLMARISARFVREADRDDLSGLFARTLRDLGEKLGADRCFYFDVDSLHSSYSCLHEWVRPGIRSLAAEFKCLPFANRWWDRMLLANRAVVIRDARTDFPLPEAAVEAEDCRQLGIRSVIAVPIFLEKRLAALILAHTTVDRRNWTDQDLDMLQMTGAMVAHVLTRRRVAAQLRRRTDMEEMVMDISTRFVKAEDERLDSVIQDALRRTGLYLGVERAYVVQFSARCDTGTETHEWVADGIRPEKDGFVDVPLSNFPWTTERLLAGRTVAVHSLCDYPPEAVRELEICRSGGIKSELFIPVLIKNRAAGCIAFDAIRAERRWTDDDIRVGRIVAELVFHALAHRRSAGELRLSESRYRMILEEAADAICVVDRAGRITEVNTRGADLLGWTRADLAGQSILRFMPIGSRRQIAGFLAKLEEGSALLFTQPLRRRRGGRVTAETRVRMLPDGRILAIVRDVSERRRLERAVLEAASREQQRIGRDLHDTLGQQLTGASFRLGAIERGLRRDVKPSEEEVHAISGMLRTAISQTRFISHGLAPVSVTGASLAEALRRLVSDTAATYRLDGQFDGNDDAPVRDAETANQLFQIAIEAVHNAVRHGKPRRLWVSLSTVRRSGRLEIRDDGAGIQAGARRRDDAPGMGLRIMRHRAEAIGGRLTVEDVPGGGTLVRVDFENRPSIVALEERHENEKT